MLERLLPTQANNDYRGHPLAKWILAALTLITLGRSLWHMFAVDGGAQSIASIPLTEYSPAAADSLVTLFALWGLSQLLFGIFYAITLLRYQSLIPLMYVFFSAEYLMRLLVPLYSPGLETLETAPGAIGNIIFLPLGLVMLFLSLRRE